MTSKRDLEKRFERLKDADGESNADASEYTPIDLTEEDYERLDEMFGENDDE